MPLISFLFTTVANMDDKYQTATATVIYGVTRVDLQTYATKGEVFRAYTPSAMGVFGTIVFLVLHIDSTQIGLHCSPILMARLY